MADSNSVNQNLETQKFNFRFRKDQFGNRRPPVELRLPVPSVSGIAAILQAGGKELQLLQDAIYDVVKGVAADIVGNNPKVSQENFPFESILWATIANMAPAERASISQEQWEAFAKDYMAVMPGITNKTEDQVGLAVSIFVKKLTPARTNKPALEKLGQQLALYMETANAEQFQDICTLLTRRLDTYLNAEEAVLELDAL